MSTYGLQVFDNAGRILVDTSGRYTRFDRDILINTSGSSYFYSIPGMVVNDSTYALVTMYGVQNVGVIYQFANGGIQFNLKPGSVATKLYGQYKLFRY